MTDEQIIRNKMNSLNAIFKYPSKELFEELFAPDCDYVTFMGQHLKGIDENLAVHKALAGNWFFKGAELVSEIKQIKFAHEKVAVVIAVGAIRFRWQKKVKKSRLSINTNVFIKQGDDWKLASFQNSRIRSLIFFQRLLMN